MRLSHPGWCWSAQILTSAPLQAQVTAQQAQDLGPAGSLRRAGARREVRSRCTIPTWSGGGVPPGLAAESQLFTIDAAHAAQYGAVLPEGSTGPVPRLPGLPDARLSVPSQRRRACIRLCRDPRQRGASPCGGRWHRLWRRRMPLAECLSRFRPWAQKSCGTICWPFGVVPGKHMSAPISPAVTAQSSRRPGIARSPISPTTEHHRRRVWGLTTS